MKLLTSILNAPVWNTSGHIDRTILKTDPTEGTWLGKRKGNSAGGSNERGKGGGNNLRKL